MALKKYTKTTLVLPNELLQRLKREATERNLSLRELTTQALSQYFGGSQKRKFKLDNGVFLGQGLASGIQDGDWATIRDMIYSRGDE